MIGNETAHTGLALAGAADRPAIAIKAAMVKTICFFMWLSLLVRAKNGPLSLYRFVRPSDVIQITWSSGKERARLIEEELQ